MQEAKNPEIESVKVTMPIITEGNNTAEFKHLIETPAPKASILVAIARSIKQENEMPQVSAGFSFSNASLINLSPRNKNTVNTIHFE